MNNVFASEFSFDDYAQGAAFVNNLFAGPIVTPPSWTILRDTISRTSPMWPARHSLTVAMIGTSTTCSWLWTIPPNRCVPRMPPVRPVWRELGPCSLTAIRARLRSNEQLIEEAGLGDEELYRSVKQPVLLASNAYVSGAKAASGEAEAVVSGDGSSLALRETDDELWMTVSLPESIRSATGPADSTADLGQPRIVEEYFENPDGSPIVVDRDITGAARGACSARGPLAAYGDGEVLIWSK